MHHQSRRFDEEHVLHELHHYLPAQAPLKDFIHHNSLHAFQHQSFFDAIRNASKIFGYKTSFSLNQYRARYFQGEISKAIIHRCITNQQGKEHIPFWMDKLFNAEYKDRTATKIGRLRSGWKNHYKIDLNALVHINLFRILNSFLDQGIAIWKFPVQNKSLLDSLKVMEGNSMSSFFKTKRARKLLLSGKHEIQYLLSILIGNESLYSEYLFDQQFSHPGWSGLVANVEVNPAGLFASKKISLKELIILELLLEIDALDDHFGEKWKSLDHFVNPPEKPLFENTAITEEDECIMLWQEAFEWSYYDQVLFGLSKGKTQSTTTDKRSFQALFCIDDRNCSLRRYVENLDTNCSTYGTPGHFGLDFYFQPENGKFHTKVCPAPVQPKFLIKESGSKLKRSKDAHFHPYSHHYFFGWLIAQTLGFWSAFRLFLSIFKPSAGPAITSSFQHMDADSELSIEHVHQHQQHHLQVGYTVAEMTQRVANVLNSIGLISDFAPIVYIIGHGASSVNNTHYAGYDCGACSGRPGSVNAKAFAYMANHTEVRSSLHKLNIHIPDNTYFLSALQDTTRDEIIFFETKNIDSNISALHNVNVNIFNKSLELNAKERSRRFETINSKQDIKKIHEKIKLRSVSLFEPRPELNHATNALCIIGRREITKHLFLDRRAFMNSYDYRVDPQGDFLLNILNAAAPVCGGINLEYYFSRVDNQKLGAGSKLPHNVMGLIGVANGIEGDLRPGLPLQMIEVHDPLRLMIIIEQKPDKVLQVIQKNSATYEWFKNDWIKLVVIDPDSRELYLFKNLDFEKYECTTEHIPSLTNINSIIESNIENLPVYLIPEFA